MMNTQGISKFEAVLVELWKTSRRREREKESLLLAYWMFSKIRTAFWVNCWNTSGVACVGNLSCYKQNLKKLIY
jgi:hypothetical protein